MAEESDIFPIVKILEDINQADKDSASSKYIKKEEIPDQEPTSYIENISNALDIIIKRMGSIEKELKLVNKEQAKDKSSGVYESSITYADLNKKTSEAKQKPSTSEIKSVTPKQSSTLSETEKQRYKSIFEIFSKTVGIGKFAKDGKPFESKTADKVKEIIPNISSIPKTADKVNEIISTNRIVNTTNIRASTSSEKERSPEFALVPFVGNAVNNKPSTRNDKETKVVVSDTLSSSERRRYVEIFEILGKVLEIGKFAKGPEANRLKLATTDDKVFSKTLPPVIKDITPKKPVASSKPESSKGGLSMTDIIGLALLYDVLNNNFSGIVQSLYRTVKSLGPLASRTLSLFKRTVGPALSSIKDGLGRAASTIKEAFKGKAASIRKSLGDAASSISRVLDLENIFNKLKDKIKPVLDDITSTLSRGITDGLSKLKEKFGTIFDDIPTALSQGIAKLKDKIKPVLDDIGSTLSKGISDGLSKLKEKFGTVFDDIPSTLSQGLTKLKDKIKPVLDDITSTLSQGISKLIESVKGGLSAGAGKAVEVVKSGASAVTSGASKVMTGIQNSLPSKSNRIIDFIKSGAGAVTSGASKAASAAASSAGKAIELAKAGGVAVASGASKAATAVAESAGKAASAVASGTGKVVSKVKTAAVEPLKKYIAESFSRAGGARGVLKGLAKASKFVSSKIPIVGPLTELFFGKGQIEEYKKMRASNKIKTDDELYFLAGQRLSQGIAGLLGGAAGAAAINLFTGGAATLVAGVGTLAGGLIGDAVGRLGAKVVTNYLIPQEYIREVGKLLVDSPIREEELQDFLVKDNKVYKFNDKDEVLGMKAGGAINNLISSVMAAKDNQYDIASKQFRNIKKLITDIPNTFATQVDRAKEVIPELPSKVSRKVDSIKLIIPELTNTVMRKVDNVKKIIPELPNTVERKIESVKLLIPKLSNSVINKVNTINKLIPELPSKVSRKVDSIKLIIPELTKTVMRKVDRAKEVIPELPSKVERKIESVKILIPKLSNTVISKVDTVNKLIPELPGRFKNAKENTIKAVQVASKAVSTLTDKTIKKIKEEGPKLKVASIPATVNKAVDLASREVRDRVYSVKTKSEVLGKKAENSFNNLVSNITSTNDKQFSIATRQVKVLEEIREGIKALIAKETNNINNYNNTSGGRKKETRPSLSPFNLRSEFDSMNNIATI